MNISTNKQKRSLVSAIFTAILVSLILFSAGFAYWYFVILPQGNSTEVQPADTKQTDYDEISGNNYSTGTSTDKDNMGSDFVEGKTPEQYDGQNSNNGSANSAEYNNEQFRIPEVDR